MCKQNRLLLSIHSDLFSTTQQLLTWHQFVSVPVEVDDQISHSLLYYIYNTYTSSTRTRRGGSCLKNIYETFLIYRTCMRRAPAKPLRACTLRRWCPVPHVTFEAPLRTSHSTLDTALFALHTSHFTLHTSHFTLHTPHFTLHTALFLPHTSHCTLHLIWALLTSSQLISSHLSSSQPGPCVRALCDAVAVLLSRTCPHTSHCTLHTSHLNSFHLVSCLPICQLRSSWLFSCHLSAAQTFSCVGPTFNLSRRFCTSARLSVTHVDSSTCQKA